MGIDAHVELITGTMFSGKSTELIRRLNRYSHLGLPVQTFKPVIDDRYSVTHATSHDGLQREVIPVTGMKQLLDQLNPQTKVVGIDEVQFLEDSIIDFANTYAQQGGIVVVSGLLKDYRDGYFTFKKSHPNKQPKTMAHLVEIADSILQLKALCKYEEEGPLGNTICGRDATRVQLFIDGKVAPHNAVTIQIGGAESYAPRCRKHFHFYE